jgi:hypothetical protein
MSRLADDLLVIRKLRRDLAAAEHARSQARLRQARAAQDGRSQDLHAGFQLKLEAQSGAAAVLRRGQADVMSIGQHVAAAKQADVIIAWRRAQLAQAAQVCADAQQSASLAHQKVLRKEKGLEQANTFKAEDAQGQARETLKKLDAQEQEWQELYSRRRT